MALDWYLAATNRLLQNPVPATPFYSTADLTAYINQGRQQAALDGQCVRANSTASLVSGQQIYAYSIFTTFPLQTTAAGSIFFPSNPTNGQTVGLNGVTITFVSGTPSGNQVQILATCGGTIDGLNTFAQASVNPSLTVAHYTWSGGPTTATFLITYATAGTAGNSYTLAASAAQISGPHLTGGGLNIQGIQSVVAVRQMAIDQGGGVYKLMSNQPWAWFNRYYLMNGAQPIGLPTVWSQQGVGANVNTAGSTAPGGSFGLWKVPNTTPTILADCICTPVYLTTDNDPEVLPYPFGEAVPYYAAYLAYMSNQRTQDATVMFGRYQEFLKRAVDMTAPPVLPMNYQGGIGAQILGSKTTVTSAPASQGR